MSAIPTFHLRSDNHQLSEKTWGGGGGGGGGGKKRGVGEGGGGN